MGEKKSNFWKILVFAVLTAAIFASGFFIGRKTIEIPEEKPPVYIQLPPVHDTIDREKIKLVKEKIDSEKFIENCIASGKFYELFPEKIKDSIIVIDKTDSTKIVKDWMTERYYADVLFDSDTLGRFEYNAKVQYNQLMSFGYNYTPIQKQQTFVQNNIKKFSPFVGVGMTTLPSFELDLGAFINDSWGFGVTGKYNVKSQMQGISKYDVGIKAYKKF